MTMKKLCQREEQCLLSGSFSVLKSPTCNKQLFTANVVKLKLLPDEATPAIFSNTLNKIMSWNTKNL